MISCPECNADQKYKQPGVLGGTEIGFYCGAVWVQSSSNASYARKGCNYRPPKECTTIGVDLASGPDMCVGIDPDTGLPVDMKLFSPEKLEELYRRHALE